MPKTEECPACNTQVVPKANGKCPACGHLGWEPSMSQEDLTIDSLNEQLRDTNRKLESVEQAYRKLRREYWFIVAAVALLILLRLISGR